MNLKQFILRTIKQAKMHLNTDVSRIAGDKIFAYNKKQNVGFFFPYPTRRKFDYRQLHNLFHGYSSYLKEKYTEQQIQIRSSDTVIDCGAFVGGFSVAAVNTNAAKVYSIEPSPKNYNCLKLNLANSAKYDNYIPLNIGLGDKAGNLELNLSISGCDDSFLAPDEGSLGISKTVEVQTVAMLIQKYNIDPNHLYLKIEAEGFEPEIVRGIGRFRPRVITVDVTPERDGESPRELISKILEEKGYRNLVNTRRCLFATLEDQGKNEKAAFHQTHHTSINSTTA